MTARPARQFIGLLLATLLAAGAASARAADAPPLSAQRCNELVRDGLNAFDEGVGLAARDPSAARTHFQSAAAAFLALRSGGVRNPAVEFNLGNAFYRLGENGRAIACYLRAAQLAPHDPRIRANLEFARQRVQPFVEASGERKLVRRLFFWHYTTSAQARWRTALLAGVVGWGLLALRLRWRNPPLLIGGIAGVALGLAAAASLLIEDRARTLEPPAVVVGEPQMLRRGRGEGYEPVFAQPLGPGVEVLILQERGDWAEIRLRDDRVGWLPVSALERV